MMKKAFLWFLAGSGVYAWYARCMEPGSRQFTQNIYAPESLDAKTIYRQTQALIDLGTKRRQIEDI